MKNKFAFTLAEVLIVVSLIGIVAESTIPTLVVNFQKQVYITQLKKFYSEFNQALALIAADNGSAGDLSGADVFTGTDNAGDTLVKYFKVIKNCKTNHGEVCMSTKANTSYSGNGSVINLDENDWGYRFIIASGTAIKIDSGNNNCNDHRSYGKGMDFTKTCASLVVDVNGPIKGPNYFGRDIFSFMITTGHGPNIVPLGNIDDGGAGWWKQNDTGTCGANGAEYCAARIMEDNWQMNY